MQVLAGSHNWCQQQVQRLAGEDCLWMAANFAAPTAAVQAQRIERILGREFNSIVYDASERFCADEFAAALGTLRAGGVCYFITGPLATWTHASRFQRRLRRFFSDLSSLRIFSDGENVLHAEQSLTHRPGGTDEQQQAVQAVLHVVHGQRKKPLLLLADRGRGKSAALGIAAGKLLQEQARRIIVTGPDRLSVQTLIQHAAEQYSDLQLPDDDDHFLRFVPVDRLLAKPSQADLLLVDEAAAIPQPMLQGVLNKFSRIAFATTAQGYEGTGKGFLLRFAKVVQAHSRGWHRVDLFEPIRWAANDPLETWLNKALLMSAPLATVEYSNAAMRWYTQDQLEADETLLASLYGLLVNAHYRMRPSDLAMILDRQGLHIGVIHAGQDIAGVILLQQEGGLDKATTAAVWRAERRPPGHLLPEILIAHLGVAGFGPLAAGRVLRIAVHPELRRRGIGTDLVRGAVEYCKGQGWSTIGTSFAGTPGLLRFWHKVGFDLVRLSLRKNAASGSHSALMLRALDAHADKLSKPLGESFKKRFVAQLGGPLQSLETTLASAILRDRTSAPETIENDIWLTIIAVSCAGRAPEESWHAVQCFVSAICDDELLIAYALQQRPMAVLAEQFHLPGRAAVLKAVRQALRDQICRHAPLSILPSVEPVL